MIEIWEYSRILCFNKKNFILWFVPQTELGGDKKNSGDCFGYFPLFNFCPSGIGVVINLTK